MLSGVLTDCIVSHLTLITQWGREYTPPPSDRKLKMQRVKSLAQGCTQTEGGRARPGAPVNLTPKPLSFCYAAGFPSLILHLVAAPAWLILIAAVPSFFPSPCLCPPTAPPYVFTLGCLVTNGSLPCRRRQSGD